MNDIFAEKKITSYEELLQEKERLQQQIIIQKMIIRDDLEQISELVKDKTQPYVRATQIIQQFTSRETRSNALLYTGTNTLIEILTRRLFAKSNMIVQLLMPSLLKNVSSHALFTVLKNREKAENARKNLSTVE